MELGIWKLETLWFLVYFFNILLYFSFCAFLRKPLDIIGMVEPVYAKTQP